jgi:hypothetical protein
MVRKVCSGNRNGSATASQKIHGYISVMPTLKFLLKKKYFVKNNRELL